MYENYLTAALAIYAIDRLVNWYHLHALRALADEAMFPADDPIMTSSIESFDYEEEGEEVPPNWEYETPEEEEAPVAAPAFDYAEEEVEDDEEEGVDTPRCMGLNKSGRQCGQTPKKGEKYCYIHKE
jgi:hypothetical protein